MNIREEWSPSRNLIELVKDGNGGNFPIEQEGLTIGTPMSIDPSTNSGFNTQMTITPRQESGYTGSYTFRYGRLPVFMDEVVYEIGYQRGWGIPELLTHLHRNKNVYLGEITLVDTSQITFTTDPNVRQSFTFQIPESSLMYEPGLFQGEAVFQGTPFPPEVLSTHRFTETSTYQLQDAATSGYWFVNGLSEIIDDIGSPTGYSYSSKGQPDARLETNTVANWPTDGLATVDMLFSAESVSTAQVLWSYNDYALANEGGNWLVTGLLMNADGTLRVVADTEVVMDNLVVSLTANTPQLVTVQRGNGKWSLWVNGVFVASVDSMRVFGHPQGDGGAANFQYGNSFGDTSSPMQGKIYRTMIRTVAPYTVGQNFDPATAGAFA